MGWLKWVIGVIVLAIVAFFAIGFFKPVVEYQVAVDVDASRTEAFAVFADVERMGEWLEGFRSIENISGAPGQVGSRWRMVFDDGSGNPIEIVEEVLAYEPAERVAFLMESDFSVTRSETRFEATDDGSRIVMEAAIDAKGPIWKSLMALAAPQLEVRSATDLGRLKRMIETEAGR